MPNESPQKGMAIILKPTIASYSGASYQAIKATLDERALGLVAQVAEAPRAAAELGTSLARELVEMHILREEGGLALLDTAVFLEADIRRINAYIVPAGEELASLVSEAVPEMRQEPPEITNLIVGILGIGQALGHTLRDSGVAVDWQHYGGRYAASKVDFDEVCEAQSALGPDLQTKTVLRGARYTAVFIGPGGASYVVDPLLAGDKASYVQALNILLTDAYPLLLTGQMDHPSWRVAAEHAGLSKGCVLTTAAMPRYLPVLGRLSRVTRDWCVGWLDEMMELLRSTTGGRQGTPPSKMILHLWRYLRRAIARGLYARGVFTDAVPQRGLITVFHENDIPALRELLS